MSEARGEIELQGKVLVIKRIHVTYHLTLEDEQREKAERAHEHHVNYCPVAQSIKDCIAITTSLTMAAA